MTQPAVHVGIARRARCAMAVLAGVLCLAAAAPAEPVRIMALGDSITVGYTDNRDGWTEPFAFGYRSGLYTRLTDAGYDFQFVGASGEPWNHETAPPPEDVLPPDLRDFGQDGNRGYGGYGVSSIAGNIVNWLNADDPDVILLMIGINNISAGSTGHPTTVENGLFNLVDTIVTTKPDAHLIVAQITPYSTYTDSIVQYNGYIRDTLVPFQAALGHNVTTVDQYQNLLTDGVIDPGLFSNGINHPTNTGYDRMAQTWFEGIQALGLPGGGPPVVVNGGFEVPEYPDPHHDYAGGIDGSGWTPTGRAGIDRGNPYGGASNCTPFEGAQMGFIQGDDGNIYTPDPNGVSSLAQDVSGFEVGETYTLSFQAKGMVGFDGVNPFYVSLGGSPLTFQGESLLTPPGGYLQYISDPITATAETMNLRFYDVGHAPGGQVSWIDAVEIVEGVIPPPEPEIVFNGSFEVPIYQDPHHDYVGGIDGSGWAATGRAGIDRGNPYGTSVPNCTPADGSQMGFIGGDDGYHDGVSSLGQDVSGLVVGQTYTLSFQAKAMVGFGGVNPFYVSLGGTQITFHGEDLLTPDNLYYRYISDPITATAETMNLLFYDMGDAPGPQTSWIDAVEIVEGIIPATEIDLVRNGSFEDPRYADPHHDYVGGIAGSGWTATGRAGIDRGNPYGTAVNSVPADGLQMGFIGGDDGYHDGVSSLGQDVAGFEIGKFYVLSFEAQAIDPFLGANPLYVSIDGTNLTFDGQELVVPDTTYDLFVSDPFLATAETLSLLFYDQGDQPGGQLSWIDCVTIFQKAIIPGDANGDGVVDDEDASIVGAHWMASDGVGWSQGDFNDDGVVNDKDAAILAAHWGQTAEGGAHVPEPSTFVLLAGVLLTWFVLRRK